MTSQSSDFNVCILGGINIDFFSVVKDMPLAGETIVGSDFFVTPGGKGANQAVACSRLGLNTTMNGRVGNDDFANTLIENFKNENISIEGIFKDSKTYTGVANIILDSVGQNSIIQAPGANYLCKDEELDYLKNIISNIDLLVLQSEIPMNVSHEAAKIAKNRQVVKGVKAFVVPGSDKVSDEAKKEGLDNVFKKAGFEWREPGCSMCLAMTPDRLEGNQISASSSNRNFKGRQGSAQGRTLLMSPAMVAAAAITGCVTDVRKLSNVNK